MKMGRFTFVSKGAKGFTLFEVLIAIVITAVGLLGLAKMQALAISTTQGVGSRSLIAVQMESLASMMHANATFWQSGAITSFTAMGTTITDSTGLLTSPDSGGCSARCVDPTGAKIAAVDVNNWVADMNNQFPTYTSTVTCTTPTPTTPVDCTITVTWTEKQVALNKTTAAGSATQVTTQSYTILVKP